MICWRQIRDLGREGGNAMELAYAEQNECAQKENTLNYSIFVEHSGDFIFENVKYRSDDATCNVCNPECTFFNVLVRISPSLHVASSDLYYIFKNSNLYKRKSGK